jgi:hypothetical protein
MTLCACGVRSPAEDADDSSTVALRGLSLRLPSGWDSYADDIGPWLPEPEIWAANVPLPDRASGVMLAPYEVLPDLPARGVVLEVVAGIDPEPCEPAPPPRLRRRDIMEGGYEGQPAPHVSSGSPLSGDRHGRCLFAQAWFGRNEPSDTQLAEANRVLESVEVEPLPPPGSDPEWRTYRDDRAQLSLRHPASWHIAEQALMPKLVEPHELVSLGTAPLRPGGECPQIPENALDHLGPKDAFVSLLEFEAKSDAPTRPRLLLPFGGVPFALDCLERPLPRGFLYRTQTFEDHGRLFQLYVGIGESASDVTRRQTTEILGSITVS